MSDPALDELGLRVEALTARHRAAVRHVLEGMLTDGDTASLLRRVDAEGLQRVRAIVAALEAATD